MTREQIEALRLDYRQGELDEATVLTDPIAQFRVWFEQALKSNLKEPNAMLLATVDPDGQPNARMVLLKGFDDEGFVFYTNYVSAKGRELDARPAAALVFYWAELERQVRIRGTVERTSPEQSDAYFHSRPPGSRIGAAVSPQSEVIPNRQWLEERWHQMEAAGAPSRPAHWGGYRVRPESIEFWQGRPSRLHDRVRYTRQAAGPWQLCRLAP